MIQNNGALSYTSIDPLLIVSANQPRDQENLSEDYVLVHANLLGVFDSVGGRDKGRLVSHLAGRTIAAHWDTLANIDRQRAPEHLASTLQALLRQADTTIASLPVPSEQRRPATTAALCVFSIFQKQAYVTHAHVGDSRVYLLHTDQSLQRLTIDNGYFPFAVRHQRLTEEEAFRIEQATCAADLSSDDQAHFARRREITCAIGWTDFPHIQTGFQTLLPDECVVLCTDGVHDNLTDQEITEILRQGPETTSAQRLVQSAYHRSQQTHVRAKRDDISAIVVWYPSMQMEEVAT